MRSTVSQNLGLVVLLFTLQSQAVNAKEKRRGHKKKDKNRDKKKIAPTFDREDRPVVNLGRPVVNLGRPPIETRPAIDSGDVNNNNDEGKEDESPNISPIGNFETIPDNSLNLVLVPQCNPADSDSFYSQSKRPENEGRTDYLEDTMDDCEQYLQYCDKKRSNVEMSWPNFVFADEFYDTVELLYDRCFKSCVEYLPGGIDEFCAMPEPQQIQTTSSANDYCELVEDRDWSGEMIAHEAAVLEALNNKRDEAGGQVCSRNTNNGVTQTFFPRRSPVTTNPSLNCAARIQAKNIVKATIEAGNRFPGNLHTACPKDDFGGGKPICEDFPTRMKNSGYTYHENGFGIISEVTAAGYRTAEAVIDGWLGSKSGHCSAVVKQESLVVTTEVGIGYYRDEQTGRTGHVMLLGQRQM